jgi:hypothetical protein
MRYWLLSAALLAPTAALAQEPQEHGAAPAAPSVTRPLRVGLSSTSAFGVTGAGFFNQLVGMRVDYRFTPRFAFGGLFSYANLEGKDRRVHNVLPEAVLEYRIPYLEESFGVPVRLGLGYLPKNGPTLRIGAGFDFALSQRVSLDVVPLEPMVWVNRERPELSLDGSVSLRIAF